MTRLWLGLLLATGCSKSAELNPKWLTEQAALVDSVCTCSTTMKAKEQTIPDTNDAYLALLADAERCIDALPTSQILVYKTPSGLEPGVDAEDLYQRREVKQLEIKLNACRDEVRQRAKKT